MAWSPKNSKIGCKTRTVNYPSKVIYPVSIFFCFIKCKVIKKIIKIQKYLDLLILKYKPLYEQNGLIFRLCRVRHKLQPRGKLKEGDFKTKLQSLRTRCVRISRFLPSLP